MMLLTIVFLIPILNGGMLTHLLWPERSLKALVFKFFLGIGIGLGIWSLLYFLFMLFFPGQGWFFLVQLGIFLGLLIVSVRREAIFGRLPKPQWHPTAIQLVLAGLAAVVFLVSLLSTGSYLLRRKQGDWDAWMMFNRAARFVYRDPTHWLGSFSPAMDPIFHADYPLLLAMDIASGWNTLGGETPHVPMVLDMLFAVGCAGLMTGALALVKSPGQAALGLIILWGTPAVVNEGSRELADLPLAFFILGTGILAYLFTVHRKAGLLVLAGLAAGLAAWTKNEGSVFVLATGLGLAAAWLRRKSWRLLSWPALGLVFPLAIVLYFKLFLAPPSDVLSNGTSQSIQQILDFSRHAEILRYFWQETIRFGWKIALLPFGVIPVLVIYYLLFRTRIDTGRQDAYLSCAVILLLQMLGYYGAYLISPYDLTWHLSYSIQRIFLQVFPLMAFLILAAARGPETLFGKGPNGANHAARN